MTGVVLSCARTDRGDEDLRYSSVIGITYVKRSMT